MSASGYIRQSASAISAGQPVASTPVNNELNQLQSAFSGTTGHDHSAGTGLGPNLTSAAFGISTSTAGIVGGTGTAGAFQLLTLTGTSNQITVTNGTGAAGNPTVAISASYVGQTSITTLGTIATGVWNGTAIGTTYGGLGGSFAASTGALSISSGTVSAGVLSSANGGTGIANSFNITLAGALTTSGAFGITLTSTGSTNVTLPTSGTLITATVATLSSLTSIGTIGTGVWQGTTVAVGYGGTGETSFTQYGVIYGNGASGLGVTAAGTAGYVLTANSGAAPTFQAVAGGGTVNAGTAGQLAYYATSTTAVSGNADATISSGQLTLGIAASAQGSIKLAGSVSGTTTIAAPTTGTGTMTLQAGTDTLVGKATTDTFTNKTFNTAGTGNIFEINGTAINAVTGNTATVTLANVTSPVNGNIVTWDASANVQDSGTALNTLAPLANPVLTGNPTATTQTAGNNSTRLATTAFVTTAVANNASGLVWLATINASGASSVVVNSTYITSTYNKYVIEFDSVYGSSIGATVNVTISTNNGSTYLSGGYSYGGNASTIAGGAGNTAFGSSGSPTAAFSLAHGSSAGLDNNSSSTAQGTIKFSNPSASKMFNIEWTMMSNDTTNGASFYEVGGGFNSGTTAINAIKIAPSAGTITGNFHIYGLVGT